MRLSKRHWMISVVIPLGILAVLAWSTNLTGSAEKATTEHLSHGHMGESPWNQGREPADWWGFIEQTHGHVGPWNVLGWRIGKAALREFDTHWGRHELDIILYVPFKTPYSCLADGLTIGTGNSIGRLDIRLAEVMARDLTQVSVRRKDGKGPVLVFKPQHKYLEHIESPALAKLETLARECGDLKEQELFTIEKIADDH